jgi:hypothetical protein
MKAEVGFRLLRKMSGIDVVEDWRSVVAQFDSLFVSYGNAEVMKTAMVGKRFTLFGSLRR